MSGDSSAPPPPGGRFGKRPPPSQGRIDLALGTEYQLLIEFFWLLIVQDLGPRTTITTVGLLVS